MFLICLITFVKNTKIQIYLPPHGVVIEVLCAIAKVFISCCSTLPNFDFCRSLFYLKVLCYFFWTDLAVPSLNIVCSLPYL